MKAEIRALIIKGESLGWKVQRTQKGHYQWKHPDGAMFYCAGTPSDRRAITHIQKSLYKTTPCINRR